MSTLLSAKKRTGRPRIDSEAVNVRMDRRTLDAINAFIVAQPDPLTRPQAIRAILADYLREKGYLK